MNLTTEDAKLLLTGLSALVIPFVIAWLPTIKLPDYAKFGILVGLSLIGGFLTAYISGTLDFNGSIISTTATIITAAQIFYYGAFRILGLERAIFPRQALATEAKEQSKSSVPEDLTTAETRDILDPTSPSKIEVTTEITQ